MNSLGVLQWHLTSQLNKSGKQSGIEQAMPSADMEFVFRLDGLIDARRTMY